MASVIVEMYVSVAQAVQRLQARVNFDPLPRAGSMSRVLRKDNVEL